MKIRSTFIVLLAAVTVLGACSKDATSNAPEVTTPTTSAKPAATALAADDAARLSATIDAHPGCDPLDTTSCLLPFPSDYFTTTDATSSTGRRVALPTGQFANVGGTTLDPTAWNHNDGFSPGTPIVLMAAGVDVAASKLPPQGDIAASMDDSSGSVIVDLTTGKRLAHWAEVDSGAPSPDKQLLVLHPAATYPEGHRIAVGFRHLETADGAAIATPLAFKVYRDNLTTTIDSIESRRKDMESMFDGLAKAGAARADLEQAWTFTIASADTLAGPLLAMRDDAFKRLGTAAPAFTADEVITDSTKLNPGIGRLVKGTFDVPLYLSGTGEPGSSLVVDANGTPKYAGSEYHAVYSCQIPQSVIDGADKARMVVYGHGLLGGHDEVENSQVAKIATTNKMIYCATDWIGMSESDVGNALTILGDISKFSTLVDRGEQGILNTLLLARVMIHDQGFGTNAAFQTSAGASVIQGGEAYFDGNSQGALMGGVATAVAQDWTKAELGVASMDYSILLSRSVDFSSYFAVLDKAYPDRIDQEIGYGLLQMLWDRIETDGYAQHLTTNPYPNTPKHQVVLDVAFGDHQVANVTSEMEARTIGAKIHQPALAAGRHPDTKPFYGLTAPASYPTSDSLLIYWDSGTLAAPEANVTPAASDAFKAACGSLSKDEREHDTKCADPHEDPRRAPGTIRQKDAFFRPDGKAIDPCDGKACTAQLRSTLDY